MLYFFGFLVAIGGLSLVCRAIFVNSRADAGIVKYRAFVFVSFLFSFVIWIAGLLGAHELTAVWGWISLALLFVFCILMVVRTQGRNYYAKTLRSAMKQ